MNSLVEGILHITDLEGYDHMLFLLALCAPYSWADWKKVILLATAFTIGHSITLALAALKVITFSTDLVELLIPVTIAITALWNIIQRRKTVRSTDWTRYGLTAGFGLIHGMGFSSYFRMMFNDTGEIVKNLLLFNLGVELGQVVILLCILSLAWLLVRFLRIPRPMVSTMFSSLALLVACWLIWERVNA